MNSLQTTIVLSDIQEKFCKQCIPNFSLSSWNISVAGVAGSERTFLRLSPTDSQELCKILILWNSQDDDWERFLTINKEVDSLFCIVPKIYAFDANAGLILEEDCGVNTVYRCCIQSQNESYIRNMYQRVIDSLIQWHRLPLMTKSIIASRRLDKTMLLWETEYFARHCVDNFFQLGSLLTTQWEKERADIAALVSNIPLVCLHRDFQSENVIIQSDSIKFVDYQGARLGPAVYDIASLLYDPYASYLNQTMRFSLLEYYKEKSDTDLSDDDFYAAGIQRLSQALGAYGNLFLQKGKKRYKRYIPLALSHLGHILTKMNSYPHFNTLIQECRKKVNSMD